MPPTFALFLLLIVGLPAAFVYAFFGAAVLYVMKKPITLLSLSVFVGAGLGCGFVGAVAAFVTVALAFPQVSAAAFLAAIGAVGSIATITGSLAALRVLEVLGKLSSLRPSDLSEHP